MLIENNIKGKSVLICASLFLVLLNPVITWAENCPEGQKWNDRVGEDSDDPDFFQAYLDEYPNGHFALIAKIKIKKLKAGISD